MDELKRNFKADIYHEVLNHGVEGCSPFGTQFTDFKQRQAGSIQQTILTYIQNKISVKRKSLLNGYLAFNKHKCCEGLTPDGWRESKASMKSAFTAILRSSTTYPIKINFTLKRPNLRQQTKQAESFCLTLLVYEKLF